MGINAGDVISIRHYSGINPFKSVVLSTNDDILVIKLTKEFAAMNFLEGDPVTFGFEAEDRVHIVGCDVARINARENVAELRIDKIESGAERREHERFPVSLYADIKDPVSRKKFLVAVKDISYYGMLIYSKEQFPTGQNVEIDIYMDKTMMFLKGNILRKIQGQHYMQYGLKVMYDDLGSMNYMKDFLRRLKETQEEFVRRLKNA